MISALNPVSFFYLDSTRGRAMRDTINNTLFISCDSLNLSTARRTMRDLKGFVNVARVSAFFVSALALLAMPLVARGQLDAKFIPSPDTKNLREVDISASDPDALDMGVLPIRQPVIFGIPLRNSSKEQRELADVSVSCGCMVAAPSSTTFKSGEVTFVYLRVSPTKEGSLQKQVRFTFKDESVLAVNVTGIVRPLHSVPAFLELDADSDKVGISVKRNFQIDATNISSVLVNGDGVTGQALGEEDSSSTERKVELRLSNFVESGALRQPVEICVVNSEGEQHLYRCILRRKDLIRIHPSTLVERANKSGKASITAYLEGDLEMLQRLSEKGGLGCHALESEAEARIVSMRRVGKSMIAVVLVVDNRPQGARSIEMEWIDNSTKKVIGRNKIWLSRI